MLAKKKIYEHFVSEIRNGRLKTGQRMPTEKQIAQDFSVSRSTVQAVMSQLANEGIVHRQAGRGTFAGRIDDDMQLKVNLDIHNIQSFESEAAVAGDRVTYRLVSYARVPASKRVAVKLGCEQGQPVFALHRLRFIEDSCIGMELRYFSPEFQLDVPLTALETEGLHELIEDTLGVQIGRIDAALRAVTASADDARLLGVAPGAPLLVRSHSLYDSQDTVILHGESSYVEPFSFRYSASIRS